MVHEQTKVFGLVAQMNLKTKKKSEKFSYTSIFRNIWPKPQQKTLMRMQDFLVLLMLGHRLPQIEFDEKYGFRPSMVYFSTC
jgi:hypothetical protein